MIDRERNRHVALDVFVAKLACLAHVCKELVLVADTEVKFKMIHQGFEPVLSQQVKLDVFGDG